MKTCWMHSQTRRIQGTEAGSTRQIKKNITCQEHRAAGDVVFRRGYSSLQGWARSMADPHERRFDESYDQHFREVLAYCLRRGQVDDAYDAANEVFAIAWRRIEDVPQGSSARPWLLLWPSGSSTGDGEVRGAFTDWWRGWDRWERLVDPIQPPWSSSVQNTTQSSPRRLVSAPRTVRS